MECQSFTIKPFATIENKLIKDYEDSTLAFTDPGDADSTLGKCGDRAFSLVDADSGNPVSPSWITFAKQAGSTWHI